MMDIKKKKQMGILGVLVGVLVVVLYPVVMGESDSGPAGASPTVKGQTVSLEDYVLNFKQRRRGPRDSRAVPVTQINSTIYFDKLETLNAVKPVSARNMFTFYSPSAVSAPQVPRQPAQSSAPPSHMPSTSPPPPPPVSINLKFYGFKVDSSSERKQGFFAEGDEVYLAWEGDLVANRYRIHNISETTAEVEEVSSRVRRQIHLTAQ